MSYSLQRLKAVFILKAQMKNVFSDFLVCQKTRIANFTFNLFLLKQMAINPRNVIRLLEETFVSLKFPESSITTREIELEDEFYKILVEAIAETSESLNEGCSQEIGSDGGDNESAEGGDEIEACGTSVEGSEQSGSDAEKIDS